MGRHAKTQAILDVAIEVLTRTHPMTVRQVFYQLVIRQVVENLRTRYQAVGDMLVNARQTGEIPWTWIEDRTRRARSVSMWDGLKDFAETAVAAYRRNIWASQPRRVEVWLEKDALSGIFEEALEPYGVTLNVGRGYDGWSSIHAAAERYARVKTEVVVLYFGDFDPSGEDMVRSLGERLGFFHCEPAILKVALTQEDVTRYNLPPDFTKATDSRAAAFVAKYGDQAVELDALPVDVLRARLVAEVESRLDLTALAKVQRRERTERRRLAVMLGGGR